MTQSRNDKDSSENSLQLSQFAPILQCTWSKAKTSSPVTYSLLKLGVCLCSELFAHFAISPRILNTPAPFALTEPLLKESDTEGVCHPQAPVHSTVAKSRWDRVSIPGIATRLQHPNSPAPLPLQGFLHTLHFFYSCAFNSESSHTLAAF